MTRNRWIIFAVVCAAIIGALIFFSKQSSTSFSGDTFKVETTGQFADHVFGSTSNKVVLFEYGDFQCPGCGGMYPIVKQLKEKYKDDLTFVFRNFPLTTLHPNALAAATAAEAVARQGKFFEMHNKLYENQDSWKDASIDSRDKYFESYAQALGVNIEQYKRDVTSDVVVGKINHDRAVGKTAKVSSTPTFFLQGEKLDQTVWGSQQAFEKKIQEAITKATGKKFEGQ